ncbi:unnamed protein product [Arctogadus glacialis]
MAAGCVSSDGHERSTPSPGPVSPQTRPPPPTFWSCLETRTPRSGSVLRLEPHVLEPSCDKIPTFWIRLETRDPHLLD